MTDISNNTELVSSNQESLMNNSIQTISKEDFKKLSEKSLIDIFIENDYSLSKIDKTFGFFDGFSGRVFRKKNIDYISIKEKYIQKQREEYEKSPNYCAHCKKPLPWEKRNNKFCSSSCSASENNIGKVKNPTGKGKVVRYNYNNGIFFNDEGTELEIDRPTFDVKRNTMYQHNKLIDRKYPELNIPHLQPMQCIICGNIGCTDKFCKDHNFRQLIGLTKLGFNASTIGTRLVKEEFYRLRELIYDLYWNQELSTIEIAKIFGLRNDRFPPYILDNLDIPRRNLSESTTNAFKHGKLNPPTVLSFLKSNLKACWHISWEGTNVYLRSSYELDYANYLDSQKISYKVEEIRLEYFDTLLNKKKNCRSRFLFT